MRVQITRRRLLSAAVVALFGASPALASRMDSETHTLVITKLEQALKEAREDETLTLHPVRARLADLYADRARLRAMEEAEINCQNCKGAEGDRERALSLYHAVLKETDPDKRGAVLLQMAHLYDLNGEPGMAIRQYERILREGHGRHAKAVIGAAYTGRGEIHFSRAEFREAQRDFTNALNHVEQGRKGYLTYRIAWTHLNQGRQKQAVRTLLRILQTPALMTRTSSEGTVFDSSFQEDVAHDLATFMARGPVERNDIRLLISLAPEASRRDVLKRFAMECERLGNKWAALHAWGLFIEAQRGDFDHLQAMVHIAGLRFDLGQRPQAVRQMRQSITAWKTQGCDRKLECDQLRGMLRKIVTDWSRMEKRKPSGQLLESYQTYLSLFADDMDMTYWAAGIARALGRHAEALELYHKTSLLAADENNERPQNNAKSASRRVRHGDGILESSLVGEIEMAELTKKPVLRQAAYDHYLKMNPNGAISHQVRYQRAHVAYETGATAEASQRFHELATSKACRSTRRKEDAELCLKAADLDLDSLVLLKSDALVESRALRYAGLYATKRRLEYFRIARTAGLKLAEKLPAPQAVEKLEQINTTGAGFDEKVTIYKLRLAASEKARDLGATARAASEMLGLKSLSGDDREFALSRQAWAAEMRLDFATAYRISKKMKMPDLRPEERAMRLALLAELAGGDSRPHEDEFLRLSKNGEKRAMVRAKMVRSARRPLRELKKHEFEIQRYPAIYAPLALEIYARTRSVSFAKKALAKRGVSQDPAGATLRRILFLKDFSDVQSRLARHEIRTQSERAMRTTMTARLALLGKVEEAANEAISERDLSSQLVTLDSLAREYKRMAGDIRQLPVPTNLKGEERKSYLKLVEEKVAPYRRKQSEIERKMDQLWSESRPFEAICDSYRASSRAVQNAMAHELETLAKIAPWSVRRKLNSALDDAKESADAAGELLAARQKVAEKPFEKGPLEDLKSVAARRGNETMVAYLDARISALKGTQSL